MFAPILAILAPVLVVVATLHALAGQAPQAEGPPKDELDARIAGGADVVLIGNSKVGTDLDTSALAAASGIPSARVVKMHLNGTAAPVWYAVLKTRVFGPGHRPKIVVVYSTLRMMMQVELPSAAQRALLAGHLGGPDPVVDRKVFGVERSDPRWERVLTRRTELRMGITDVVRDAVVGVVFAANADSGLLAAGRAVSEPALARVLGSDMLTQDTRAGSLPVVEIEQVSSADRAPGPEDTMMPDIARLAREHGAEVVFLRAPMGSAKRDHDVVAADVERAIVESLGAAGAAYVDLRPVGPPDSAYGDASHMSQSGRARFTPGVLDELAKIGFGTGPLTAARWAEPRPRPAVERTGPTPSLPRLVGVRGRLACDFQAMIPELFEVSDSRLEERGLGEISPLLVTEDGRPLINHGTHTDVVDRCGGASLHYKNVVKYSPKGDAPEDAADRAYSLALDPAIPSIGSHGEESWWIWPGSALRFTVPGGSRNARVRAIDVVPGPGAPTFAVDAPTPLARIGTELLGVARGGAAGGPWTVEVASPADGPWLLLTGLAVGDDADPWYVIGGPPEDTSVDVLPSAATYARAPKELAAPAQKPKVANWRPDMWVFPVEVYGVPDLEEAWARAGVNCSSLRLRIGGVPVERPADPAGAGALAVATHSQGRMLVRPDGEGRSIDPGAEYRFYLDPTRLCVDRARWLYPGDELTLAVADGALAAMRSGAAAIQLAGTVFRATEGETLSIAVRQQGRELAAQTVPVSAFDRGALSLDAAIPRDASGVTVTVRLDAVTAYALLTAVSFVEPPAEVFGGR